MKLHQWEVWKAKPPGFERDHWFVIISGQERCDESATYSSTAWPALPCADSLGKTEVQLNGADGLAGPTALQCDYLYSLDKRTLHSGQGLVSWERQQAIKSKVREVLRF